MLVRIFAVVGISVFALISVGCPTPEEDESVSVSERINSWENAINNGGSEAGGNLHPTASQYDQAQAATFWQVSFPTDSGETYTVGDPTLQSGSTYTTTITGGTYTTSDSLTFTMLEDGSDVWMIKKLVGPSGTIVE